MKYVGIATWRRDTKVTRLKRSFGILCKASGFNVPTIARLFLFGLLAIFAFTACTRNSPVPEADYPAKLVGDWLGTVGDTKETISFKADGNFIAQVRQAGFISNTLSQGTTGTIRGTWNVAGKTITMRVTGADNENVRNKETSSTIESFTQNELVVRSVSDETSTFMRAV